MGSILFILHGHSPKEAAEEGVRLRSMALVHPGGLTYTTLLRREIPRKGGTAGLGPSPSWVPIETDEDGESGNSVSDKVTIRGVRTHLGTDKKCRSSRTSPHMLLFYYVTILCLLAQPP